MENTINVKIEGYEKPINLSFKVAGYKTALKYQMDLASSQDVGQQIQMNVDFVESNFLSGTMGVTQVTRDNLGDILPITKLSDVVSAILGGLVVPRETA